MRQSQDKKVQSFLDEMQDFDASKHDILQALREIVLNAAPRVSERMMYGGIMFSLADDFGGIFAYKNHVSFEFSQGADMQDAKGVLEGKGKLRRHLKITNMDDIQAKNVVGFVTQAVA